MKKDIDEVIKKLNEYQNMETKQNKVAYLSNSNAHANTYLPTPSNKQPICFNTFIKWELPIQLCPTCMALLRGMEPEVLTAFTNLAKGTTKKKKPVKYKKKVEKEAELEKDEVL